MSGESRLRSALADQAAAFEPSVESSLESVRRRAGRPRPSLRWALAAVAASVLLIMAGIAIARFTGPVRAEPARAASPSGQSLVGRLTASVTAPPGLAGDWILNLHADGTTDVTAPAEYPGVLSATLFSSESSSFRTTLFQQDICTTAGIGSYRWTHVGDEIRFTVASDSCAERRDFFTANRWTLSTR